MIGYELCENCEKCAGKLINLDGEFEDYICNGSFALICASESMPNCKHYIPRQTEERVRNIGGLSMKYIVKFTVFNEITVRLPEGATKEEIYREAERQWCNGNENEIDTVWGDIQTLKEGKQ